MNPLPPQHAPASGPPPTGTAVVAGRIVLALLLGGMTGLLGTVAHRTEWVGLPLGVVLGMVLTVSGATLCRAWAGVWTFLGYGVGWLITVQVLAMTGPGGDVIVPAQPVGYAWMYGGLALLVAVAFLPRRWFVDGGQRHL